MDGWELYYFPYIITRQDTRSFPEWPGETYCSTHEADCKFTPLHQRNRAFKISYFEAERDLLGKTFKVHNERNRVGPPKRRGISWRGLGLRVWIWGCPQMDVRSGVCEYLALDGQC